MGVTVDADGTSVHIREGYDMTETSTDVAVKDPIDLDTVPAHVRALVGRLKLNATTGTAGAQIDIMATILQATTEEEIFAAANAGTLSGQDVAGRPFLVQGHEFKASASGYVAQGAFPYYTLIRAKFLDNGEECVLNCGGFSVVAVIDSLDRIGVLNREDAGAKYPDGYPMVLESRRTAAGFDVIIPRPYTGPLLPKTQAAK